MAKTEKGHGNWVNVSFALRSVYKSKL